MKKLTKKEIEIAKLNNIPKKCLKCKHYMSAPGLAVWCYIEGTGPFPTQ